MPRKQTKSLARRQPLITRILDAAPGILVREVVATERLNNLPPRIRDVFGAMKIRWASNRAWGLSFTLGKDTTVTIGHRRGDHLCTHPDLYGLTDDEAESLLCIQIEGTLLHELGHAVFDLYLKERKGFKEAAEAALADGAPSTYRGQDVNGMTPEDLLHEMFAEAFRYWCHANSDLRAAQPSWDALATRVIKHADKAVTAPARRNGESPAAQHVRQASQAMYSTELEYDWLTEGWPGKLVRPASQAQINAAYATKARANLAWIEANAAGLAAGLTYDELADLLAKGERTAKSLFTLVHGT